MLSIVNKAAVADTLPPAPFTAKETAIYHFLQGIDRHPEKLDAVILKGLLKMAFLPRYGGSSHSQAVVDLTRNIMLRHAEQLGIYAQVSGFNDLIHRTEDVDYESLDRRIDELVQMWRHIPLS
jgi:hypothetical protein